MTNPNDPREMFFECRPLFARAVGLGRALGHGWAQRAMPVFTAKVVDPEAVIGAIRFFEAAHNAEDPIPAGASYGFRAEDGRLIYESGRGRILADLSRRVVTVRSSRGDLITVRAGVWDEIGCDIAGGPESLDDPWVADRVLAIRALLPDWVRDRCLAALERAWAGAAS